MTKETGRVCAVCGKTKAPSGRKDTYGFHSTLRRNGLAGDKAHPECVQALGRSPDPFQGVEFPRMTDRF